MVRGDSQAGLGDLLDAHVRFSSERVRSGAANATAKLTAVVAGMGAGAGSIDDLDVVRSGGMRKVFTGVYAAPTLGILLREFTFGHAGQLSAVLRRHLLALADRTGVLDGIEQQAYMDVDSLLRPVSGHAKQGASFGHTKISGKAVLRRGLSALATAISTPAAAPVVAGIRLRAGKAGSGRGAASMVREAVLLAKAAGAGRVLVRGDSAYGSGAVVTAARNAGAMFSVVLVKNPAVTAAISGIDEDAWVPVRYPNAVQDPDTGEWISDAQVAETTYTAFSGTPNEVTARLVVRRVKDKNQPDGSQPGQSAQQEQLFTVWRHHPFLTDNDEPAPAADITHRRHAVVETLFSDLIDGPLAHLPSGLSPRTPPGPYWPRSPTTCRAPPPPSPPQPHRPAGGPRRHDPPPHHQHPGQAGPPATPTGPPPTRACPPVRVLASTVAHRVPDLTGPSEHPARPPNPTHGHHPRSPPRSPTTTHLDELDRPADHPRPTPRQDHPSPARTATSPSTIEA